MKVPIRRVDKDLPLPAYKTAGAAAMDCTVRADTTIPPGTVGYVPLNVALKPPRGHFLLMAARSSLHKRGVTMANGIGIGDEDFCGNGDEYRAALLNFSNEPVEIKRGDRVVQILILPVDRVEWEEVETLGAPDRGGYGTTGIQ
ncbi:dUTP diphosphatase [Candidatus Kaiserbacteria bacterium]|nr:dUTP diphosphatase [Candidatus Kaiserbacteria bacterium]